MESLPIEAKVITHLSKDEVGEDIHIVKEVIYNNGIYKDKINIIKDYQRPYHITKPIFRNHVDKKESEELKRTTTYTSNESDLFKNVSNRLGIPAFGKVDVRKVKRSPYLYGVDVDSRTYLKHEYMANSNNAASPYRVGVFDIEFNVLTSEMIVLSIATKKHLKVALLKSFADTIPDIDKTLDRLYDKFIPSIPFKRSIKKEIIIFDTEVDMISYIFREANYMDIDILTAWNIFYDITTILDILEIADINPADIFHYPEIPDKYKHFSFIEGNSIKRTEAGREIGISVEERWHVIKTTANYQMLDNMASHRYIRVGGATVPGGYSLDNILKQEGVEQKLKFESNQGLKGIEWHIDMVANKPAEYIVYNEWDIMSILTMDDKTKDLTVSLPLLAGVSHVDIFNSGPRRLVDALTFFYAERGLVLGTKAIGGKNDKILGLGSWVVTLQSFMSTDNGLAIIKELEGFITNIKAKIFDLDNYKISSGS